jgi:hypothetical protein
METEHHYQPKVGLYAWSNRSSTPPTPPTLIYNTTHSSMWCLFHPHYLKWTRCVGTHDMTIHNISPTFRYADRSTQSAQCTSLFFGELLLESGPNLKLEDHPLSVIRRRFYNISAAPLTNVTLSIRQIKEVQCCCEKVWNLSDGNLKKQNGVLVRSVDWLWMVNCKWCAIKQFWLHLRYHSNSYL